MLSASVLQLKSAADISELCGKLNHCIIRPKEGTSIRANLRIPSHAQGSLFILTPRRNISPRPQHDPRIPGLKSGAVIDNAFSIRIAAQECRGYFRTLRQAKSLYYQTQRRHRAISSFSLRAAAFLPVRRTIPGSPD